MLTELRVNNFKAWNNERWDSPIELAPVTLFLGANSSGKTSLLQTLLLLKQTFSSPDRKLDLNLGGQQQDRIDFGSYKDVIHKHEDKRSLGVGFTIKNGPRFECSYTLASGVPVIERLTLSKDNHTYEVGRQGRGGYLIGAPNYKPDMIKSRQDARRSFAPERSLAFSPEALAEVGADAGAVQDISLKIGNEIGGLAYLGPLRQPPERTYLWSRQTPSNLGDQGQFAVAALLARASSKRFPRTALASLTTNEFALNTEFIVCS